MPLLLVQMAVVLLTALACGWVARRLGQARVIGKVVGRILVGPSILGRFVAMALITTTITSPLLNPIGVEDRGTATEDLAAMANTPPSEASPIEAA